MRRVLSILLLAFTGACTVGPDYHGPPSVAPAAQQRGTFVRANDPALTSAPGVARWWEMLQDATLTRLVDEALRNSPTIDLAQARLREARARLAQGRANLLPTVAASAMAVHADLPGTGLGSLAGGSTSGGNTGSSDNSTSLDFYNIGANVSWEPDLFGGVRRGIEAARATVGQRYADLGDAQVSLSAQVAQSYVNLRDAQARTRLNARSTALLSEELALTRQRYAAGTATKIEVERLQAQLGSTRAQDLPLSAQVEMYKDALAVLCGRAPGELDNMLAAPASVPLPPPSVPIGDPAMLIAQRPDVRAAERALASSTANIGVQKAKTLPGIKFMGILGMGGTSPGDVLNPANLSAILMPQLSWPILDFGRGAGAVREAKAQRDEAAAQYAQAVLKALQDAEDSLARFGATRRQLAELMASQQSASAAAALNRQRYRAGTTSLIDQLDVERQELSAAMAVAQARAQLTIDYIVVQKALGLGWSEPPASR